VSGETVNSPRIKHTIILRADIRPKGYETWPRDVLDNLTVSTHLPRMAVISVTTEIWLVKNAAVLPRVSEFLTVERERERERESRRETRLVKTDGNSSDCLDILPRQVSPSASSDERTKRKRLTLTMRVHKKKRNRSEKRCRVADRDGRRLSRARVIRG